MEVSLEKLPGFAKKIAKDFRAGDVIGLSGEIAAGKTTFVKELLKAMGYTGRVGSPTFVLERRYRVNYGGIKEVIHLDFYRLSNDQVMSFDWQEHGDDGSITIIEWPEIVLKYLPKNTKTIRIEIVDGKTRRFTL